MYSGIVFGLVQVLNATPIWGKMSTQHKCSNAWIFAFDFTRVQL